MTAPTPDPTTTWFPISKEQYRLAVVNLSTIYVCLILMPGMLSFLGLLVGHFTTTIVPLVPAGVIALVGVVHSTHALQAIRRSHQVLGVESRGLWLHDSGSLIFLDWDTIRAVQLHNYYSYHRTYAGSALDLFPVTTLPVHNPRKPHDRHRIELTRAPMVPDSGMLFTSTNLPYLLARTIAALRPDKYIGPT